MPAVSAVEASTSTSTGTEIFTCRTRRTTGYCRTATLSPKVRRQTGCWARPNQIKAVSTSPTPAGLGFPAELQSIPAGAPIAFTLGAHGTIESSPGQTRRVYQQAETTA